MLGEMFWVLAGAGALAKESIQMTCQEVDGREKSQAVRRYIESCTDAELEQRLKIELSKPSNYNEIWDRIEIYKRDGGYGSDEPTWDFVGRERLPLHNEKGRTLTRSVYTANLYKTLGLLMNTYGKRTRSEADYRARH